MISDHTINVRLDLALMAGFAVLFVIGSWSLNRALDWFERVYLD